MANTGSEFSPQQSILLIQSVIDRARDDIPNNRFYFLVWGWLTFIGFIGQYILKAILNYEKHYYVWLLMIAGAITSIFYSIKKGKTKKVDTWIDSSMKIVWQGVGAGFIVISIIFAKIGWENSHPFFILLYGLGTFISGRLLNFTPLIAGGLINWILAIVAIRFSFDYQLLFAAGAILTSYLIPGYLLKKN